MIDTSEKRFEADIESFLLSEGGGYTKGDRASFDKEKAIDLNVLVAFVSKTQEKAWARYQSIYNGKAEIELYKRFNESVNTHGLIKTLRIGLKDRGVKFDLVYFAPTSGLNPELTAKYNKNIVAVTRQFYYSTQNKNSIDMVLSVNGIPIVALELKNQFKGQSVKDSKKQFKENRDPKEPIFGFNKRFLVYFAVDLYEAWMTTELKGVDTFFLPFNQGSGGAGEVGGAGNPLADDGSGVMDYLWKKVLQKDMLLRLLQRYISLEISEDEQIKFDAKTGKRIKTIRKKKTIIFPRYHQLDVVEKLVADVSKNGSGKNYLIQHSAGSGKSNSIAWLAHKLQSLFYLDKEEQIFSSVIVVTDRRVLDRQLQDTIYGFDHVAGVVERIDDKKSSQDLKDAINDGKKIIITTLQKFPVIFEQVNEAKGKRYAVIVDEAHSSQSGKSAKKLTAALADRSVALEEFEEFEDDIDGEDEVNKELTRQGKHKNLSFFAFTATPKEKTLNLFGIKVDGPDLDKPLFVPFHIYSMRQAIEEGFIHDVLLNYTTVEHFFKIAKATTEDKEYKEIPAIKSILKYYQMHRRSIEDRVELIVEQFRSLTLSKVGGKAKAMVVCPSREYAIRIFNAIKKYIAKKKYTDVNALVAFTDKITVDKVEYTESKLNKTFDGLTISEGQLPKYFKSDEFNTLIVADKYQTGFDEPRLHTMFILKKLHGVRAVQALSRVNRTAKWAGKVDTFIMDFANTAEDIQKAFQQFYEGTILEGDFNVNAVYDKISLIRDFCLFNDEDIEKFIKVYYTKGDTQTAADLSKLAAIFKPVVDRFDELEEDKKAEYKDHIKKFNRFYAFVTQLVRMFDSELHKTYLFLEHLIKLLPKKAAEKVNLDDQVRLEFTSLKETFSGSIELKKGGGEALVPKGDKAGSTRDEKKDLLSNIVDKINIMFEGNFGDSDRVMVEAIYDRLVKGNNRQLKKQVKNNTAEMFVESIFPKTFEEAAQECYAEQTDAFSKLFEDKEFFQKVMGVIGKALYSSLKGDEEEG